VLVALIDKNGNMFNKEFFMQTIESVNRRRHRDGGSR
jgi:hypothetical protein